MFKPYPHGNIPSPEHNEHSLGGNVTSTFVDMPEQILIVGDSVSQTLCHCNEIPDVSN